MEHFLTHSNEKFAEYELGQVEDTHQPLEWSPNKLLNVTHCSILPSSVAIATINTHGKNGENRCESLDNLEIINGLNDTSYSGVPNKRVRTCPCSRDNFP